METKVLDINQIMELLPHRYPFLLIDRVTEIGDTYIKGYKNITINEPFFQGHFPGDPIMPGVLLCEAAAQLGVVFVKTQMKNMEDKLIVFAGLNNVKFRRSVLPGDKLEMKLDNIKFKLSVGKVSFESTVNGEIVCTGDMTFSAIKR